MKTNLEDPDARKIPYDQFLKHYVWNVNKKMWT